MQGRELEDWEKKEAKKTAAAIGKRLDIAKHILMEAGIGLLDYGEYLCKAIIEDEVRKGNL